MNWRGHDYEGADFSSLGGIITDLLPAIFSLAGMIALLFLIWGGIRYMTSRGDPKAADAAKGTITSAVIGLLIVLFAAAIYFAIGNAFRILIFSSIFAPTPAYAQVDIGNTVDIGGTVIGFFTNFGQFFTRIVRFALGTAALVFFAMLVYSGFSYLNAGGDAEKAQAARQSITNAGIGVVVVVLSLVVIEFITSVAGRGDIF